MLRAIGALTIIIILLGLLTGVIEPLELWNIIQKVALSLCKVIAAVSPLQAIARTAVVILKKFSKKI